MKKEKPQRPSDWREIIRNPEEVKEPKSIKDIMQQDASESAALKEIHGTNKIGSIY